MSQGFGFPAFAVDTHIHRLAQRWGLSRGRNVIETERDLKKIFPKSSWSKLHLQTPKDVRETQPGVVMVEFAIYVRHVIRKEENLLRQTRLS